MEISYLGHSAVKIKSKGTSLLIDPFDPGIVGIKYPAQVVDIVAITHEHKDHNFLGQIKDCQRVIRGPGEYEIKGISILGFRSFHDAKKGGERGTNTMYVIESEGIRLLHLGDLGHELTEKDIENFGEINVLFVPVGGVYTIDAKLASELSRSIDANITIPIHYKINSTEGLQDISEVEDYLQLVSLTTEKTNKLNLKASDFGDERKVVLLSTK